MLKYLVKQILRYYQAISTKISRADFQGIKICPDSSIDYEYQGSIQASTESKPTRMKPKNYTRTKTHQNIAETTPRQKQGKKKANYIHTKDWAFPDTTKKKTSKTSVHQM